MYLRWFFYNIVCLSVCLFLLVWAGWGLTAIKLVWSCYTHPYFHKGEPPHSASLRSHCTLLRLNQKNSETSDDHFPDYFLKGTRWISVFFFLFVLTDAIHFRSQPLLMHPSQKIQRHYMLTIIGIFLKVRLESAFIFQLSLVL